MSSTQAGHPTLQADHMHPAWIVNNLGSAAAGARLEHACMCASAVLCCPWAEAGYMPQP